jgi:hypothetical protein
MFLGPDGFKDVGSLLCHLTRYGIKLQPSQCRMQANVPVPSKCRSSSVTLSRCRARARLLYYMLLSVLVLLIADQVRIDFGAPDCRALVSLRRGQQREWMRSCLLKRGTRLMDVCSRLLLLLLFIRVEAYTGMTESTCRIRSPGLALSASSPQILSITTTARAGVVSDPMRSVDGSGPPCWTELGRAVPRLTLRVLAQIPCFCPGLFLEVHSRVETIGLEYSNHSSRNAGMPGRYCRRLSVGLGYTSYQNELSCTDTEYIADELTRHLILG